MSAQALESYLSGRWQRGEGVETRLYDPVRGDELATVSAKGLDLAGALAYARRNGQGSLRGMSYGQRAKLLGAVSDVLVANRARYEEIAIANSGNTKNDAAIDIDGGIGTLKYYARLGSGLGEARMLLDEKPVRLAKAENYQAVHVLLPRRGVAVHINAFNFPSWGLWEKAAVSLLAGVPVFAKPASATALLAHAMVKDVIEAKVLPEGAAEPPLRLGRRSPLGARLGRCGCLYRLGRYRGTRARRSQRDREERAGEHRGRQHQCGPAGAGRCGGKRCV